MAANGKFPPLQLSSCIVLITGGSQGIGLGLAQRFLEAGSTVVITGRRAAMLDAAKESHPRLHTRVSDAASVQDRQELAAWMISTFPGFNVLVNNAGQQRVVPLALDDDWPTRQLEIAANLEGPAHLASLVTRHFLKQKEAAIINITSGLAFIPCAFAPMYGATKAALHSFTVAMRPHYAGTNIAIVEIAPPPVKTNLPSSKAYGEDNDEFCDNVFDKFTRGEQEIGYKLSDVARLEDREAINKRFDAMTQRSFKGPRYADVIKPQGTAKS